MRYVIVIGWTLLAATALAVSAAAQVPPAGSAARGGVPTDSGQPAGQTGRHEPGVGRQLGDKGKEKEKLADKLSPISVMPLQHYYYAALGGQAVGDLATDDVRFYAALKNGAISAFKVEDGSQIWTFPGLTVVQDISVDSGRLYVALDGEIGALEAETGKGLWRLPSGGKITTAPIAKSGWLIVTLDTGEVHALRGESGEKVWETKLGAPVMTRPVLVGDRLYVAPQNNQLIAIDLMTGKALWNQEFDGGVTAIAAQGQRVFAGTARMFFGLDHAGHLKWTRRIGSEVIGQPAVDDENVYVAFTDNTLMAFGASRGDMRWRTPLNYRPTSGPTRADDTLLLYGLAIVVHGYSVKDGKAGPDFPEPADPQRFFIGSPHFAHGPTFFQDTVLTTFSHGYVGASRRTGPSFLSPFTDLGVVCPPLSMPGEAPPPATASAPTPPKS